jgi:hypothetical protein
MRPFAADLNAVFAEKFAPLERPRFVIDPKTCEEVQVTFPHKHDLLWIPVHYWTYIILGFTAFPVAFCLKDAP